MRIKSMFFRHTAAVTESVCICGSRQSGNCRWRNRDWRMQSYRWTAAGFRTTPTECVALCARVRPAPTRIFCRDEFFGCSSYSYSRIASNRRPSRKNSNKCQESQESCVFNNILRFFPASSLEGSSFQFKLL